MFESIKNIAFTFAVMVLIPYTMHYGLKLLSDDPYTYFSCALTIGIACIIAGTLLNIDYLGAGCIIGGMFGFTLGVLHIWSDLTDAIKFVGLFIALFVVVGLVFIRL